ncbi:MAG: hypothetical protein K2H48_04710 [Duncaniella sp.]|nr:hypothetical protein [Duncaniella sp.]
MKYKDEQCPKCGNYVRGQFIASEGIELLTKGGKSAVITGVDLMVPYLGTGIDFLFGKTIDKAVDSIKEELHENEEYEFECPRCGHSWITNVGVARLAIPDEVIEQVRAEYVSELKNKRPYVSFTIFALITLYCVVCMFFIEDTSTMMGAGQLLIGMFCIVIFIIPTIIKWNKISSLNDQIETIENLPLRDFLHQHKDMFSQYLQINRKW